MIDAKKEFPSLYEDIQALVGTDEQAEIFLDEIILREIRLILQRQLDMREMVSKYGSIQQVFMT